MVQGVRKEWGHQEGGDSQGAQQLCCPLTLSFRPPPSPTPALAGHVPHCRVRSWRGQGDTANWMTSQAHFFQSRPERWPRGHCLQRVYHGNCTMGPLRKQTPRQGAQW